MDIDDHPEPAGDSSESDDGSLHCNQLVEDVGHNYILDDVPVV